MKRNTLLAAMTLAATAFGGAAFADANHGHGWAAWCPRWGRHDAERWSGHDGEHGGMMDMMTRMHGNMMGGGMMGGRHGQWYDGPRHGCRHDANVRH